LRGTHLKHPQVSGGVGWQIALGKPEKFDRLVLRDAEVEKMGSVPYSIGVPGN